MLAQSEMYQNGYNDYNLGECHFPEDAEYFDGWCDAQWDAEAEFENAMEAELFLQAERYENEHYYVEA